jgi:2-keto-4-pentenoate hydratase/2-oxohepta-3-ene-1,7-dioic acid hydratase in catechol pathway
MIEIASHIMTLEPGDIIAAGTPAGVGPIKGGDYVKIEFEKIGSMTIMVKQTSGGRASIFETTAAVS